MFMLDTNICSYVLKTKSAKLQKQFESETGNIDTLIAAHALQQDCILVTNNTKHFSRVAELNIVNWL